jgi:DNA-binding NarL/FixJ family response regulator
MPNSPETSPLPVILLCAPAGRFQESLRILLSGLPLLIVGPVAEARSTSALVQAWQPTLVLLDFALEAADISAILRGLQTEWPQVGLIALVDNVDQSAEARARGIKNVLLRGFRLEELHAAIRSQLANVAQPAAGPLTPD